MLAVRPTFQVNSRGVGLTATILLHAVLLAVLLSQAPVRNAMRNAAPIIVSLIRTPEVEKPVQPPKPLPQRPSAKPVPQQMAPVPMPLVDIPAPATFQTIAPDDAKPAPEAPAPGSGDAVAGYPTQFQRGVPRQPGAGLPAAFTPKRRTGPRNPAGTGDGERRSGGGRVAHEQRIRAPRPGRDRNGETLALRAGTPRRSGRCRVGTGPYRLLSRALTQLAATAATRTSLPPSPPPGSHNNS